MKDEDEWYRIEGRGFVVAVVFRNGVCVDAAPYIRKNTIGKEKGKVLWYWEKKRGCRITKLS